jgi:phytoene dehydrogenase-like protein
MASTPQTSPGKVVIIGGGIAGLSCGCYLRMNGYPTEILEANNVPGGLCVAWERGPFIFDGCLRWLVGTDPNSAFHQVWRELGAIAGREIINRDEFLRVEGTGNQVISLTSDLDRLSAELKQISPRDGSLIDELVGAARCCSALEPPIEKPLELMNGFEKLKLLIGYRPMLFTIGKWKNRKLGAYLSRYHSPFVREALMAVAGDPRMSALVLVMVLAFRSRRNAGYVLGGSKALSESIAERFLRLGGSIRYNAEVTSILVEDGQATGVRFNGDGAVPASTVVSCADGHTTIFNLLGGRFVNRQISRPYQDYDVFPGLLQVSLGVNQDLSELPGSISLPLSPPLVVDDETQHTRVEVAIFGSESGLCPAGKSIVIIRFCGCCSYWTQLRKQQSAQYQKAKERVLEQVIRRLDQRFPGLAGRIEYADLATPATFVRFTGNWQASYQGWLPTPQILGRRLRRTLPGLRNFYMAGQWVEPGGGVPPAALSGRYVAQMICARDSKPFVTTTP